MGTLVHKMIALSVFLYLISTIQVESAHVPEEWNSLLQRTKRSLLWRWNTLKPVGASCREHSECGTKYCRYSILQVFMLS
uniref:Liver-expressed antimicrobial peptide 2 n=1 Tax=Myripristis murdjan TaxID=586833 RepID=A0A668AIN0_9TELE